MRVGIALGSNLGDRVAHLRAAVTAIREFAEPPVLVSRIYETEPVDCPPDSPIFLNAAVEIGYSGEIMDLLQRLQTIEQAEGRQKLRGLNTPRTVDLDILYADDFVVNLPGLTLPHPRLMSRLFVLLPLNDIVPDRRLPNASLTFSENLKRMNIMNTNISQYTIDQ